MLAAVARASAVTTLGKDGRGCRVPNELQDFRVQAWLNSTAPDPVIHLQRRKITGRVVASDQRNKARHDVALGELHRKLRNVVARLAVEEAKGICIWSEERSRATGRTSTIFLW